VVLRGTLNNWKDKDQGWSVEGKIPWKDFMRSGGRPAIDQRWKFALCRYDYSVAFEGPELSTCAPLKSLPNPDFHHHEDYAGLKFIGPPEKDTSRPYGIERRLPLTTSTVVGSPEPPPPYRVKKVFSGLKVNFPIAIVHQPGSDRLIYCTATLPYSSTSIWRMRDASDPRGSKARPGAWEVEKLLDQKAVTYGFTFHPDFKKNGYIYLGLNEPSSGAPKKTKVVRYTINPKPPYTFDPKSRKVIIEWLSDGHNGAGLAFGHDGMLYVTSGDGTSDSDTNIVGQDMSTLLAKVLRIDVDHPEPGKAYAVPKDNPFLSLKGARPEIWAYGLRNPWRMTADEKTGHIWVAQNGQDLWEQAYLVKKGDNYGWSVMEGGHPFYPTRKAGPTPFVKPTVEHPHSEARSLTGGIVYYGSKLPELRGAYIYGDYSTGKVWGVRHDGTKIIWHKELADTRLQITAFAADSRGEILIADHRGEDKGGFYTLEPTPPTGPSSFPRTLSASGLFRSVKNHEMEPALIPYSVNAPLWGDKAFKKRWIALPGADSKIDFTTSRGWNFPEGTVLVKSFGLELEESNPASRRWIETRFLTKQQGEWYGYSYAWNDEQTEGFLVEGSGKDRRFEIGVPKSAKHPDGKRTQVWHYPSRTECMVCHSRAAIWVLGLTELQMNKVHDYGHVKDNQLRTLEHLGLFKIDYAKKKYRSLVDPYDPKADLTLRARSYLHSNCSQCHVEAGGGNAQFDAEFTTALDKTTLINVKPQHHTFNIPDARLIAPGHPERSVLLYRVSHRKEGHMPPLATSMVDEPAVAMLREWIRQMPK
jgi:uncharacterized repeat protein (TIGR03806 family)